MINSPRLATVCTTCLTAMLTLWTASEHAPAQYARQQLEQTPVERLVANLTEQVNANPKDVTLRHNLARVHAMAYASKSETAPTTQGAKQPEVWFGYEPRPIPFVNKPTEDKEQLRIAAEHLQEALSTYAQVLKMDAKNLTARLGHAWCLDQAGQNEAAITAYRKTIELGWEKEKGMQRGPLGWHSIVAEAHQYLLPHLDPQADADEIARNKKRIAKLSKIPRPITPIAIPLAADLAAADIENHAVQVKFDADGSGEQKPWSWINHNAAWLVYDQSGNGQINSALQMFGNVSFWCFWQNGYQALASLDNNHDGSLQGAELAGLGLWHDRNMNGVCDAGEVRPLAAYQIVALSTRYEIDGDHSDRIAWSFQGVTYSDGRTRPSFDLVLQPGQADSSVAAQR